MKLSTIIVTYAVGLFILTNYGIDIVRWMCWVLIEFSNWDIVKEHVAM